MEFVRCAFEPASYLIISSEVAPLIYYSHFVAIFAALAISIFVFLHNPTQMIARLFLVFSSIFSLWAFLDVVLWATNDPGIVMFSWAIQVLIEPILFAMAFFLFYLFLHKKLPSFNISLVIVILLTPLVLLLPTDLNLEAVFLSFCESEEGPIALYYTYFLNIAFICFILYEGIRSIPKQDSTERSASLFFIVGLITFLFSFTSGNFISSFTDDWTISQYGLFGMPVFASLIAYSIVRFKIFRMQVAGAQILVVALVALIGSLLFVGAEFHNTIIILTLCISSISGFFLIKSVRKEFEQRLKLEQLTNKLEKANKKLRVLDKLKSEFVSIASHQLRSPLTAISGYASMLLEGSYGTLSKKAEEAVRKIQQSSRFMTSSVEDYLNVSRIQSGNMKYEMTTFNFKEVAEEVVDILRPEAVRKGLLLSFESTVTKKPQVHADIGKVRQIIQNLIDNAIKYTDEGEVMISVYEEKGRDAVYLDITDTGIGMSKDTLESIFGKFERAEHASTVNVTGTGLGLYIAHKMAEDMGGQVTADSDGEGEGSTFTIMFPKA